MHGWTLPGKTLTGAPHLFGLPAKRRLGNDRSIADRSIAGRSGADRSDADSAGDEDGVLPVDARKAAHLLLTKLSTRAQLHDVSGRSRHAFWKDPLAVHAAPHENPDIASGYTYLLQLMAHDMVDTGPAAMVAAAGGQNARTRPLMLDTIYGAGPDGSPSVYQATDKVSNTADFPDLKRAPRRFLRVEAASGPRPNNPQFCPFHDIARGDQMVMDSVLGNEERPCDPLIADARNDAHAIMSQMTVLFHAFHNAVMAAIKESTGGASKIEMAYRRFVCARALVTLVYRRIVRDDVLGRILHPGVRALYARNGWAGPLLAPFSGVPVEFSRGVFRFGHAMVRDTYAINGSVPHGHAEGLFLSMNSSHKPEQMPLKGDWMIDWAHFFDMRGDDASMPAPNLSHRIGPRYTNAIEISEEFEAKSEVDNRGLMHRDLKSSLYGELTPVPVLLDALRAALERVNPDAAAELLPPWEQWQGRIDAWLSEDVGEQQFRFSPEDRKSLAADPPMPFFVAFEAAMRPDSATPDTTGMGRHLGPIGSFMAAETILGSLGSLSVVEGELKMSLADAISAACKHYMGSDAPNLVPGLTDTANPPRSMPALLRFMKTAGAFIPNPPH